MVIGNILSSGVSMQCMLIERDIVLQILSVRPSVCPSNAGTASKRMDISSHFLTNWHGASF